MWRVEVQVKLAHLRLASEQLAGRHRTATWHGTHSIKPEGFVPLHFVHTPDERGNVPVLHNEQGQCQGDVGKEVPHARQRGRAHNGYISQPFPCERVHRQQEFPPLLHQEQCAHRRKHRHGEKNACPKGKLHSHGEGMPRIHSHFILSSAAASGGTLFPLSTRCSRLPSGALGGHGGCGWPTTGP